MFGIFCFVDSYNYYVDQIGQLITTMEVILAQPNLGLRTVLAIAMNKDTKYMTMKVGKFCRPNADIRPLYFVIKKR